MKSFRTCFVFLIVLGACAPEEFSTLDSQITISVEVQKALVDQYPQQLLL